ncbi:MULTISPECIES: S8 family serine peptidase [Niastella]|uniref:S8 family serine peptidase n=1 Tax=Niastella soli TaxID=2821487 RepID=A0ABS3YNZ9_9BACT|nr:S8 family serine peptidase [Niastella soli]MBO9199619.1 S8 family serine peptidase [Niastella soli]
MQTKTLTTTLVTGLILLAACRKNISSDSGSDNNSDTSVCPQSTDNGSIIPDQYIVAYRESTATDAGLTSSTRIASFTNTLLQRNKINLSAMKNSFFSGARGFVAHLSQLELARLRQDSTISRIENDRIIAYGSCFKVVEPKTITWNVERIGYGDGTGKTAWIIDSGIDFSHPDLNADSARSKSFINGVTSARDDNGHGTHIAGIIGAKNNSVGVLGVASNANLVALKVFDKDGKGTLGSIIQALSYVNANAKAGDVVNMSLGEDTISNILDQAVINTAAKGIYIAIAAGNDGKPANQYSPGRVNAKNVYTVSAVDSLDNFASFSNYGNDVVDLAAPGVSITSTYLNGKYAIFSGTSMATPHVAGLLLLKGSAISSSGVAKNDPDGTPDPIAHK